jgi:serine/threonine protein kinase
MLTGIAPFQFNVIERTYQQIVKGEYTFPKWFKCQDAKDLINKILVVDPAKRYTFQ